MGRKHRHGPLGDLGHLVDEDRPTLAQLSDDVLVVHDLLAHIDRRAVQLQRVFHRLHRAIDPRAVPARRRQEYLLNRIGRRAGLGHQGHCRTEPIAVL
jgi:hypothetical protein